MTGGAPGRGLGGEGGEIEVSYYGGGQNPIKHQVDSFFIQTTEITCKQYQEVMGGLPNLFNALNKSKWNDNTPVTRFDLKEANCKMKHSENKLTEIWKCRPNQSNRWIGLLMHF